MVITLELPIRSQPSYDPLQAYAERFGALPPWIGELEPALARYLSRRALNRGIPLAAEECLS